MEIRWRESHGCRSSDRTARSDPISHLAFHWSHFVLSGFRGAGIGFCTGDLRDVGSSALSFGLADYSQVDRRKERQGLILSHIWLSVGAILYYQAVKVQGLVFVPGVCRVWGQALPRSGWPTILELTYWGTSPKIKRPTP